MCQIVLKQIYKWHKSIINSHIINDCNGCKNDKWENRGRLWEKIMDSVTWWHDIRSPNKLMEKIMKMCGDVWSPRPTSTTCGVKMMNQMSNE